MDVDDESIDLQWVAPRNNGGAITAYIVRILLSGGEEYSNMFQTTSATVSRDDFQGADDPNRSIDIDYQVRVAAINVAGTGEEGSENFLFLAGKTQSVCSIPCSECAQYHFRLHSVCVY